MPALRSRNPWRRELVYLAGWLSAALLIGFIAGIPLIAVLAALSLYLLLHLICAYRLHQWLLTGRLKTAVGVGIWRDIHEALYDLKQRDMGRRKRLRRIVAEFNASTEALPDATVVLDADSCIVWCNSAAIDLFGLRPTADRGLRVTNLVRHPGFSELLSRDDEYAATEMSAPTDHARTIQVRVIAYGARQRLVIARDISREKHLDAMRRNFVANASHELRTPLTVLRGYLEILDQEADAGGPMAEWHEPVDQMDRQARRMDQMIDDLLRLARLEAEPHDPGREWLDVAERITRAVDDTGPGEPSIDIECDRELWLYGDYKALESVVTNLVSNARRHTADSGHIRIDWRATRDGAELSVADDGCGIGPEHVPRLTERFYRVDKGRDSTAGGTGLGLAIVKHALANHGAELRIESEPGEGARFICCFPANVIAKTTNTAYSENAGAATASK